MTTSCKRGAHRAHARPTTLAWLLMGSVLPLLSPGAAHADPAKGTITSVCAVVTPRAPLTYDITLTSATEFPMRNETPYLNIGGKTFTDSHYLAGGTLNTIVFTLTAAEYQALKAGDHAILYYGADDVSQPDAQWDFGSFSPAKSVTTTAKPVGTPITSGPVLSATPIADSMHKTKTSVPAVKDTPVKTTAPAKTTHKGTK